MSLTGSTKPPVTQDLAFNLCAQIYSQLSVVDVIELDSYDDRNFLITCKDGEKYVLKITNSLDSMQDGVLEAQNRMMLHLHKCGFRVPEPIPNSAGQLIVRQALINSGENDRDRLFAIRLLRFVPGRRLCDTKINAKLLSQCGKYLASLQSCINASDYPTNDAAVIKLRQHLWSLECFPQVRNYLHVYDREPERRECIERILDAFKSRVIARKHMLTHGYIHGDFNEQNILCNFDSEETKTIALGVIDFGDICYGPRIFDLAICIAYMMLLPFDDDPENFDLIVSDVPRSVLRGFISVIPLTKLEISLLPLCSAARLAQSLTLGMWTYKVQQPNNEYLLTSQAKGWQILKKLLELDLTRLANVWSQK